LNEKTNAQNFCKQIVDKLHKSLLLSASFRIWHHQPYSYGTRRLLGLGKISNNREISRVKKNLDNQLSVK